MTLTEKQDYVFYESGLLINSKQPLKNADVCTVSTKDYVFFVPKKTTGMFVVLKTIKTHQFFDGVSIEQGVRALIDKAETVQDLESSLTALLEDDEIYVHKIAEKTSFKFKGFLGKQTLMMRESMKKYSSVSPNGKGNGKEFKAFHGQ